ncbi:hypothetical protein M0R45_002271 [Rubus argutus]|uniref:Uncharacterized protein n=1 Tax=Rubus argutus TaxID=59490 RepID=A0AAW1VHX5_RUBAR
MFKYNGDESVAVNLESSDDTVVDYPRLAVSDEALDYNLDESYDSNSTVYIDAGLNGSELVYRVEKKGGLVNAVINQKSDVWIQLSKEPRSTDAHQAVKKMKFEKIDEDHDMDK